MKAMNVSSLVAKAIAVSTALFITTFAVAGGKTKLKKASIKGTTITEKTDLKTDVNFSDGASVFGNYGNMSEGDASVEAEKNRIDLIEPRKKWNLKLKTSKEWH